MNSVINITNMKKVKEADATDVAMMMMQRRMYISRK